MTKSRTYKVKKKITGVQKNFRKWSDWEEGDVIIGKYVSIHEDNYDHECMVVEVEEAHFSNKKEAKEIQGKNLVLNHSGSTNKAMKEIKLGAIVQVTYNGMGTIESGKYAGKESHMISIDEMYDGSEESEDVENEEDDIL